MPPPEREVVDGLAIYRRPPSTAAAVPSSHRVLLVHGSMDRAAGFLKVARRLTDIDVTMYDRRGYGRSVGAGVAPDLDAAIADLLTVLGDRPSVVVGHSLGGVLALAAAARHPQLVPSVAAFEAPMPWLDWWPGGSAGSTAARTVADGGPEQAAEAFMRRMVGDERWEQLPAGTRRQRRDEGLALVADISVVRGPVPPYDAGDLAMPVLSGFGSGTHERHRRAARVLAVQAVAGELMVIEGAGHVAPTTHPEAFAGFVRRALARA